MFGGERSEELVLFGKSLILTVTDLGGCIDKLEIDLGGMPRGGWLQKRFSDGDLSLSWTHNTSLNEQEVLVDNTVVWESAKWGDVLDIWVILGGGIVINTT